MVAPGFSTVVCLVPLGPDTVLVVAQAPRSAQSKSATTGKRRRMRYFKIMSKKSAASVHERRRRGSYGLVFQNAWSSES